MISLSPSTKLEDFTSRWPLSSEALRQEALRTAHQILEHIRAQWPNLPVRLFGSVLRPYAFYPDSDLDFIVNTDSIAKEDVPRVLRSVRQCILSGQELSGLSFDLVPYPNTLHPDFANRVWHHLSVSSADIELYIKTQFHSLSDNSYTPVSLAPQFDAAQVALVMFDRIQIARSSISSILSMESVNLWALHSTTTSVRRMILKCAKDAIRQLVKRQPPEPSIALCALTLCSNGLYASFLSPSVLVYWEQLHERLSALDNQLRPDPAQSSGNIVDPAEVHAICSCLLALLFELDTAANRFFVSQTGADVA